MLSEVTFRLTEKNWFDHSIQADRFKRVLWNIYVDMENILRWLLIVLFY